MFADGENYPLALWRSRKGGKLTAVPDATSLTHHLHTMRLALALLVALLVDMPRSLRVLCCPDEWLSTVRTPGSPHGLLLAKSRARSGDSRPTRVRWHGGTHLGHGLLLPSACRMASSSRRRPAGGLMMTTPIGALRPALVRHRRDHAQGVKRHHEHKHRGPGPDGGQVPCRRWCDRGGVRRVHLHGWSGGWRKEWSQVWDNHPHQPPVELGQGVGGGRQPVLA